MSVEVFEFSPSEILPSLFDYKAREACRSCKRYGAKATCPPYCETISYYQQLLPTYNYGVLLVMQFTASKSSKIDSEKSSLALQKNVLDMRKALFLKGHIFSAGFGAGSCKICASCSVPCRFPDRALVPVEAAGINVIKLVSIVGGINIKFPVEEKFFRVGMIVYD